MGRQDTFQGKCTEHAAAATGSAEVASVEWYLYVLASVLT